MCPVLPGRALPSRPDCPVCGGVMELVYDRFNQQVCVCVDCHSGLTIPAAAWEVQRQKLGGKRQSE